MSSHYIVLSRKYRPKNLDDLIGQDVLAKSLKESIDHRRVPHAFLFHGIRGIGKTTTARILARCLNCVGIDGTNDMTSHPCGECRSCRAMDLDQHMDVMEIDAASRTGVDDIRELIDSSQYMPVLGRYKIFIIDEVHMLSKSAFNALLKTLEEPPSHVKFIFATTEINKIPETILSRCMTFNLRPVSQSIISDHLMNISKKEGFNLEIDAANEIAIESEGSVRDSLSILEQAMMLSLDTKNIDRNVIQNMLGGTKQSDVDELLRLILCAKIEDALIYSEKLMMNGVDAFVLYKNLQNSLYKLITDVVNRKNNDYKLSNLLYIWQIFLNQTKNMRMSFHPEHVLNAAIIIMSYTSSFPSIEDIEIKDEDVSHKNNDIILSKKQNNLASKVEDIIGGKVEISDDSQTNNLIKDVLQKFKGAVATDLE